MKAMAYIIIKIKPLWVLVLLGWLLPVQLKALSRDSGSVFENIKNLPAQQRITKAMLVYKGNYRNVDAATAMKHLDELVDIAHDLNDKQLECSVFEMRADYYSV